MANTNDTSNFLPCPFCGADPEAQDWHGGPRARIFIQCPNGNYDDEHGGCSVGPQVVGSDIEDAAARWNRRAQAPDDLPPVPYNEHEKELLKEIESRDYWEEKATELAERVGEYFGLNVGEHSNINCPVQTALEADWQSQQAQGEWVRSDERLPAEADTDTLGFVWTFSEWLGITALDRHSLTEPPFYTHWKPTGLTRPQPPKTKEGSDE